MEAPSENDAETSGCPGRERYKSEGARLAGVPLTLKPAGERADCPRPNEEGERLPRARQRTKRHRARQADTSGWADTNLGSTVQCPRDAPAPS